MSTNDSPVTRAGEHAKAAHSTHQKALAMNLDSTSFGSFAEIGAGQEVARWFLRVGGASGTVAKTVSAYDKEVSDDLYGSGTRYVSRPRLEAMLDREWTALVHQVGEQRGATTRLFAFANTIAARNFAGTNDCHGWIGVRFQDRPRAEPSDILLHINLRESANVLQQETVGVVGVNLLYALLGTHGQPVSSQLPQRLFDNLEDGRVEVDQIELRGGAFASCNVRTWHSTLARDGRAEALTFSADGTALPANEFLYKKAVVIAPTPVESQEDLPSHVVASCVDMLRREVAGSADVKDVIGMRLVTVDPGLPLSGTMAQGGDATLMTLHRPLYRTTTFVRRYTQAPIRFVLPLPAVMRIFDEARYQQLEGRLLEGIARLFGSDVRMLAYPCAREQLIRLLGADAGHGWDVGGSGPWITADQVLPAPPLKHLYEYLLANNFLASMPPK